MKNLIYFAFLLPLFLSSCNPNGLKTKASLNFVKNTDREFEQILSEAKVNKKVIFVDVYATWCGPCKWMDANTFTDPRVAERFNRKFINYKVDGESFSGVNIALQYRVDSYPTYLFLNSEGKVLKRMEGMMATEAFLQETEGLENLAKN